MVIANDEPAAASDLMHRVLDGDAGAEVLQAVSVAPEQANDLVHCGQLVDVGGLCIHVFGAPVLDPGESPGIELTVQGKMP